MLCLCVMLSGPFLLKCCKMTLLFVFIPYFMKICQLVQIYMDKNTYMIHLNLSFLVNYIKYIRNIVS